MMSSLLHPAVSLILRTWRDLLVFGGNVEPSEPGDGGGGVIWKHCDDWNSVPAHWSCDIWTFVTEMVAPGLPA